MKISLRHCEERSDEALQLCLRGEGAGLLRFARNDGARILVLTARFRLSFACSLSPSEERAQGKPGAECTRSLEGNKKSPPVSHHEFSQSHRLSPRNGFTVCFVLSPVSGVFCHRCLRDTSRKMRHGRGARTTRLRRTLRTFSSGEQARLTPQRPSHLTARLVTIAIRPFTG